MTANNDPKDEPSRSSETVAILDFATPSGLTPALATPSGLTPALSTPSGLHRALTPSALHRAAQTTGPADLDVADPSPASSAADRPLPPRRKTRPDLVHGTAPHTAGVRRLGVRALFFAVLLAALTWGVFEVRKLVNVERQGPRPGAAQTPGKPAAPDHAAPAAVPAESPEDLDHLFDDLDEATYPGQRAMKFLATRVKRDGELDGPAKNLVESGAIARQAVTVVNFWATWCGPCKQEFAGFQKMFATNHRDNAWNDETRFVPILVDDDENALTAYRDTRLSMPPIHAALVDQKLDHGGVRGALQSIKLLPPESPLPVTLLFDCHRLIRWSKIGALDEASFVTLAEEIDKLRAELGQKKCRDAKPTRASARPTTGCNHDGTCQESRRENCRNCPDDCACTNGECSVRADGIPICKEAI